MYLGIQKYFHSVSFNHLEYREEVLIEIHGLKLFKSSNRVLWPILGAIIGFNNNASPFMTACFSGFKKPQNLDRFMADFCAEVMVLKQTGIRLGNSQKFLRFNIRLFICDSPAKAFATGVVSHNSKSGCSKCCQEGIYRERRVCFSKKIGPLRTDITFQDRCHHHSEEFKETKYFRRNRTWNGFSVSLKCYAFS